MNSKKIIITLLIINLLCTPVCALELDTSIDDNIRRNYNPDKIEDDMALPALPKILNETQPQVKPVSQSVKQTTTPTAAPQSAQQIQMQQASLNPINNIKKAPPKQTTSFATICKGSKIRLTINNAISDHSRRGTKVSFVSRYPITTTYFTIPTGTVFYGEILSSHRPQLSGNGGLIVLNVNKFVIDGQVYSINAVVTEANHKMIFFNNIKGKRKYVKSVFKSMKPGFHFLGKMMHESAMFTQEGSTVALIPFALALGVLTAAGNVFVSPALGLCYKGDHIQIKEGSNFEIKLTQDLFIYH